MPPKKVIKSAPANNTTHCLIEKWFGRLGNNIIQIINSITFAKLMQLDYVYLRKSHSYLSSRVINVSGTPIAFTSKTSECKHKHTYYHTDDIPELQNSLSHRNTSYEIFHTYIKPIYIHSKIHCQAQPDSESTLYIHIRSGDIFSEAKPHKLYVQPPLSYYDHIITMQKPIHIILVSEDRLNPCINALLTKYAGMINHVCNPGDPKDDIAVLCQAKNIVFGLGTFSYLIMCISGNLAKVWFPKYDSDTVVYSSLSHIQGTCISLPGYMKPGDWANTPSQRKLMLEYELPDHVAKDG
jgi:hypothetical protein